MSNTFMVATIISCVYLLIRFVEMRFVLKENKPLKELIRDSLLVYLAVVSGHFVMDQLVPLTEGLKGTPNVFTNEPDF